MDKVLVTPTSLRKFILSVLEACGGSGEQAEIVAENLIWCDQIGRSNYGIRRLPMLCKRLVHKVVKCPAGVTFTKTGSATGMIDGGHGFGHYIGHRAMNCAIDLARETGIAAVGAKNSDFFGAGAYFVNLAADEGLVSLAMSNSFPKVAAHGGVHPVLGTNPFAFGAPMRTGKAFLLDMATSEGPGSKIRQYINQGKELPEGIAIDQQGNFIRDPNLVAQGSLLPFGGAKGFGLGLMVEILAGVVTGAGISHGVKSIFNNFEETADNGHMFIAIDIEHFLPLADYYDRMDEMTNLIKASAEGFANREIRLPGESRWQQLEISLNQGIALDKHNVEAMTTLAKEHNVVVPW